MDESTLFIIIFRDNDDMYRSTLIQKKPILYFLSICLDICIKNLKICTRQNKYTQASMVIMHRKRNYLIKSFCFLLLELANKIQFFKKNLL